MNNGVTSWLVTHTQLCGYLTAQLNENLSTTGNINSCTILQIGSDYWVEGTGDGPGSDDARNIRMLLTMAGNGDLTFNFVSGGGLETCSGDPCEECAFASNGGCTCKRTTSSPTGLDGKCNHSVSRPAPVASGW